MALGTWGTHAFFFQFLVLCVGNAFIGGLLLPVPASRRNDLLSATAILFIMEGVAFGLLFATFARMFWFLIPPFGLGLSANTLVGLVFLLEARALPKSAP